MKKILFCFLCAFFSIILTFGAFAESAGIKAIETLKETVTMDLGCGSACLMEPATGEILYEQNAEEHLEPASVTKIMTVLLIYEAMEDGRISKSDTVTASATAANMGGSQIWLEVGECFTVDEMLKAILVVSANDCTVAMAEHLAGSEEAFVALMNSKAKELGMDNTNFVNCTGLPCENHYTCAKDIAIMTRALMKYDDVFSYTTIWMDSLRDGAFGLSNTNKLIRYYNGATGMKTGFTDSAGYCMSATAKRDSTQMIAVIMKAPTSDKRFEAAKKLLDYGFANFAAYPVPDVGLSPIKVKGGIKNEISPVYTGKSILIPKGREKLIEHTVELPEYLCAPVAINEKIGVIRFFLGGEEISCIDILAGDGTEKLSLYDVFRKLLSKAVMIR